LVPIQKGENIVGVTNPEYYWDSDEVCDRVWSLAKRQDYDPVVLLPTLAAVVALPEEALGRWPFEAIGAAELVTHMVGFPSDQELDESAEEWLSEGGQNPSKHTWVLRQYGALKCVHGLVSVAIQAVLIIETYELTHDSRWYDDGQLLYLRGAADLKKRLYKAQAKTLKLLQNW